MLDMGFIPDIENICTKLPANRQTLLFSATMPPPIKKLADKFLSNPKTIEVSRAASTNKDIEQFKIRTSAQGEARRAAQVAASRTMSAPPSSSANRKTTVRDLNKSLQRDGFKTGEIHGDMDQSSRLAELDAVQGRQDQHPVRQRRRGARAGRQGRQPRLQFRHAVASRRLCSPHRPHRAAPGPRAALHLRHRRRRRSDRQCREADRASRFRSSIWPKAKDRSSEREEKRERKPRAREAQARGEAPPGTRTQARKPRARSRADETRESEPKREVRERAPRSESRKQRRTAPRPPRRAEQARRVERAGPRIPGRSQRAERLRPRWPASQRASTKLSITRLVPACFELDLELVAFLRRRPRHSRTCRETRARRSRCRLAAWRRSWRRCAPASARRLGAGSYCPGDARAASRARVSSCVTAARRATWANGSSRSLTIWRATAMRRRSWWFPSRHVLGQFRDEARRDRAGPLAIDAAVGGMQDGAALARPGDRDIGKPAFFLQDWQARLRRATRCEGNTPSSQPGRKTWSNSSPLAACMVMMVTFSASSAASLSITRLTCSRKSPSVSYSSIARASSDRFSSRPALRRFFPPAARRCSRFRPAPCARVRRGPASSAFLAPAREIAHQTRRSCCARAPAVRRCRQMSSAAAASGMFAAPRMTVQLLQRLLAQPALGRVVDPLEGEIVRRLGDHAQISQRIADLRAFVEAETADDPVVQPDLDEPVLEFAGLELRANQDCDIGRAVRLRVQPSRPLRPRGALLPARPTRRSRAASSPSGCSVHSVLPSRSLFAPIRPMPRRGSAAWSDSSVPA